MRGLKNIIRSNAAADAIMRKFDPTWKTEPVTEGPPSTLDELCEQDRLAKQEQDDRREIEAIARRAYERRLQDAEARDDANNDAILPADGS